ncbi:flippase [Aetokthonos hydrillicola Thurmond2011]|jgi:PST family polysaccharide transporter|uniref:Flippase n=1 Tax=Aetokthonos hydrillicola Thurmond2011 TaxID=2712845 RepID=A0AAP5MAJ2_9CYAN|nr:flippase [Aetokthonos hydrillicola]MBO3460963.1 flippase [Aetokthonos hydrillicola CCALA 1050]MBW4583636.1 flippase [Aetokthonos hydrillicola CCALA 1050]MDR9895669.1 flippase [Aetokthonos hydrillicola Thurmond2011]
MLPKNFTIPKLSLFKSRPKLRAVIANTGWLVGDRIFRMGVGLIIGVWVARYLGVQQYGLFNYATAFVSLFSPFAALGLDSLVVRDLVRDSSNKEEILGTTFCLKFVSGVCSLLLAVGCVFVLRKNEPLAVWLVAILSGVAIFQTFDTIDFWFQSQVQSKYSVISKNTAFIIVALIKVVLITMHAPLIAFAWVSVAEIALGAIGLAIAYRLKGYSVLLWRWSFPIAKALIKESWPLIFSVFAIAIYMKIDQIMLGQMVNDEAVGVYSAATRISEIWYFIPVTIASSVAPTIYQAKQASEVLYYQRMNQFVRFMVLISLTISVPMTFLSGTIITALFGNGYVGAGPILAIHIWSSLFVFMGVAISPWYIAEGLTHLAMYRTLMGAVTNVLLNIFLLPTYGGMGAALATVISYSFSDFFSNATHPKTRKIFKIQIKSLLLFKQ